MGHGTAKTKLSQNKVKLTGLRREIILFWISDGATKQAVVSYTAVIKPGNTAHDQVMMASDIEYTFYKAWKLKECTMFW